MYWSYRSTIGHRLCAFAWQCGRRTDSGLDVWWVERTRSIGLECRYESSNPSRERLTEERTDGRTDEWTDAQTDRQTDRPTTNKTAGRIDEQAWRYTDRHFRCTVGSHWRWASQEHEILCVCECKTNQSTRCFCAECGSVNSCQCCKGTMWELCSISGHRCNLEPLWKYVSAL